MIVGIVGNRGTGKTLTMAKIGLEAIKKGKVVYSNFKFNTKKFTAEENTRLRMIDKEFFINYKDMKLRNCIILLDEVYVYFDSRSSATKRNRVFSYFINQTRKRGVDLYYTTQFFRQVEVRLRLNTEFFIIPSLIRERKTMIVINELISFADSMKTLGNEKFIGGDYFDIYDTDEIISFDE